MTLSAPFDILTTWPGWTTVFEPLWRKEQSRQANGVTRTKDLGSQLWSMTTVSRSLSNRELAYWRARLNRLRNGEETFYGFHMGRKWPLAYPGGSWPTGGSFSGTSATLYAIGADNKSIKVHGLPAGFVFNVGDHLQIGTSDLYEVEEAAAADGTGTTGFFEVMPNLWPGTITGDAVSVKQPKCLMTIVPGSISAPADLNGRGIITFQAIEYR